jgi:hypothetical protein
VWVTDSVNNQALVFYMLVSALAGNFPFQAVGNSVAVWQNFSHDSDCTQAGRAMVGRKNRICGDAAGIGQCL